MREELARLILRLARELDGAIADRGHPAAALAAAWRCTGITNCSPCDEERNDFEPLLQSVRGGLTRAVEVYPSELAAVILRQARRDLGRLVVRAEELCAAG